MTLITDRPAPVPALVLHQHQSRDHAVPCTRCLGHQTWNEHGVCDTCGPVTCPRCAPAAPAPVAVPAPFPPPGSRRSRRPTPALARLELAAALDDSADILAAALAEGRLAAALHSMAVVTGASCSTEDEALAVAALFLHPTMQDLFAITPAEGARAAASVLRGFVGTIGAGR